MVPYGEHGVADVDGEPVELTFLPGSLTLARPNVPLVNGHDTDAPIGVLVELADEAGAARARFKIDATAAGDDALVQAASGSRAGLSVGALATQWRERAAGVLEVTAAALFHVGLVAIPAMPSAQVSRVTAAQASPTDDERSTGAMNDTTPEEVAASIGETTTDEELAELLQHEDEAVRQAAQAELDRRDADADADADATEDEKQERLDTSAARAFDRPVIHAARERGPRKLLCSGGELVGAYARRAGRRPSLCPHGSGRLV